MKNINLTRDKLSAYTEAILCITTNLDLMGNQIEEVDETTVKLWAVHNHEDTLVFNQAPNNLYARVIPNVKEWYRTSFYNFVSAYADFVEEELKLEADDAGVTRSSADNRYRGMSNDEVVSFLIKEEHEAYDMLNRALVRGEYLDAASGVNNEVLEVLRLRDRVQDLKILDLNRFAKALSSFVKLLLLRKNQWSLRYYENVTADAQDEADKSYRSGDLIPNIMLSFRNPELRSSISTYAEHRDQLTKDVIVNTLILKRVLFVEEGW